MRFEEALKVMREGKKVTRRCYEDSRFYIKGRNIMHYRINEGIDKAVNIAGLGSFDITGDDWEVINENKEKQHTDDAIAYNELVEENNTFKTDCQTLAQKLLQVKPELREWLEVNYGEYL